MDPNLRHTLRLLRLSGILGAAIRAADGSYRLWIGDTTEGVRDSGYAAPDKAAEWLVCRALALYPRSDFARVRVFLEKMAREAAASRA